MHHAFWLLVLSATEIQLSGSLMYRERCREGSFTPRAKVMWAEREKESQTQIVTDVQLKSCSVSLQQDVRSFTVEWQIAQMSCQPPKLEIHWSDGSGQMKKKEKIDRPTGKEKLKISVWEDDGPFNKGGRDTKNSENDSQHSYRYDRWERLHGYNSQTVWSARGKQRKGTKRRQRSTIM